MSASQQIAEHYATQFDTNWKQLVQQLTSRLEAYVTLDTVTGKEKTYNQLAPVEMQRINGRAQQTRITDQPTAKRWLRPFPHDIATLFDEWDEEFLGQVVLPKSDTVKNHGSAYGRALDRCVIEALGGTAYTGELGVTPVALPVTQDVAVNFGGTNSGLTLAKIIKAKSILGKNEVDPTDQLIFAYSQQQLDDLLNNVNEVKSSDYNNVKALVNGDVDMFMGFKWVRLELLDKDASDIRTCFAYAKSGVKLATGGLATRLSERNDLSDALQIRSKASFGATRTEEKKVVKIYCDESP